MTMQRIHIPHWHRPDWHTFKAHIGQLMHDGRFWAILALGALLILLLVAGLYGGNGSPTITFPPYGLPIYPHWP